jgi:hypothetical protein
VADLSKTVEKLGRFERRGPCTDAERRAAGWLHDDLRARGHEAWVETHWVRPQWALSLALHAALGVIASVTAIYVPAAGLALALPVAISLASEANGRTGLLRLALPRRATQNVLTIPAAGRARTLLICARYDAGRTPGPRAWLAIAGVAVAASAAGRLAGVDGPALGIAQFVPTVALLAGFAWAAGLAPSRPTSEADAGARRAAVALALHDALSRNPPERLAPALLLYGAGSAGRQALRSHLRRDRVDRAAAVVLELGPATDLRSALAAVAELDREP